VSDDVDFVGAPNGSCPVPPRTLSDPIGLGHYDTVVPRLRRLGGQPVDEPRLASQEPHQSYSFV
jgi:hypothetical protein